MKKVVDNYSLLFLPPAVWPVFDHAVEIALKYCSENPSKKLFIVFLDNALRFNPSFLWFDFISRSESIAKYNSIKNLFISYNCEFINLKKDKNKSIIYSKSVKRLSKQCAINSIQSQYKDTSINYKGEKKNQIKKVSYDFLDGYSFFKKNCFNLNNLDKVILFNGRFGFYRGVLEFCKCRDIFYNCFEYPVQGRKRYLFTYNSPIHNLNYRANELKKIADKYPLSIEKKISIGKSWLQKRNSQRMGYEINFSKNQNEFNIPKVIRQAREKKKKVILVLNSSEWEWSAFKESRTNYFDSQFNTFKWLVKNFSKKNKDTFFIFKFHPQFAFRDLIYKEKVELLLKRFNKNQIYIIQPESKLNTKALSKFSDLILTFYTSAAPEASLSGKKVISIGPASFQYFNCCQMVKSKDDLKKIILEKSYLRKKDFSRVEMNTYLFFFARCFQGLKPKFLKYDKYKKPFLITNGNKIYFYQPKLKFFFLRLIRVFLFVLRHPERIKFKNLYRITNIFNLNF